MDSIKVKDKVNTGLAELWDEYIGYINESEEDHRPLWVAYDPNIFRGTIMIFAIVPNDDEQASGNLFVTEAVMNRKENPLYYIDTIVFEEEEDFDKPNHLIQIYPKPY